MPNLIGSMNLDGTLKGVISGGSRFTGKLANATLRGMSVELRIQEGTNILQWKYEDETEWKDLIDLSTIDYETLSNLPKINGEPIIGELGDLIMLTSDEATEQELLDLLN